MSNLTTVLPVNKTNILEAQWAEPVLLTFHSALRKVDAFYQVSVHLAR